MKLKRIKQELAALLSLYRILFYFLKATNYHKTDKNDLIEDVIDWSKIFQLIFQIFISHFWHVHSEISTVYSVRYGGNKNKTLTIS